MADSAINNSEPWFKRMLPALSLMVLAPLIAEVLPGATRMSAIFVLPIEILVWGGAAVLIREVVRRLQLGWLNMLLLAMALSVAEECVIQQTSLAPMVIKLKGVEYARDFDVNYVYFLWALIYESLFVVLIPIGLVELIFRDQREQGWLNAAGISTVGLLFVPGCFFAWFTWTQIARTKVFHLEPYTPPPFQMAIAAASIALLIALATGPLRHQLARRSNGLHPPHPLALFLLSGIATIVIFGLTLLGFGISPTFPPLAAVMIGLTLIVLLIAFLPRFYAHKSWTTWHQVAILYGAILTNMAIFFVGFIGATPLDFYGKVIVDTISVVLLFWLALRMRSTGQNSHPMLRNAG
jgi:hypothetical protein